MIQISYNINHFKFYIKNGFWRTVEEKTGVQNLFTAVRRMCSNIGTQDGRIGMKRNCVDLRWSLYIKLIALSEKVGMENEAGKELRKILDFDLNKEIVTQKTWWNFGGRSQT